METSEIKHFKYRLLVYLKSLVHIYYIYFGYFVINRLQTKTFTECQSFHTYITNTQNIIILLTNWLGQLYNVVYSIRRFSDNILHTSNINRTRILNDINIYSPHIFELKWQDSIQSNLIKMQKWNWTYKKLDFSHEGIHSLLTLVWDVSSSLENCFVVGTYISMTKIRMLQLISTRVKNARNSVAYFSSNIFLFYFNLGRNGIL